MEFAAPGCMFNPPGSPPMPMEAFMAMIPAMKALATSECSHLIHPACAHTLFDI